MRRGASAIHATIGWLFGPIVWAAHFFLIYGIVSFAGIASQEQVRLILTMLTGMALSALVVFLFWQCLDLRGRRAKDSRSFLTSTAMALTVLALIGIVWTAAGGFIVSF
ncbi:MAG TPA: hypothetical protein VFO36_02445 [Nitrospiraceae bacterium]|nr:hypothetical protein [Nitrospiraceae bacterium]